MLDRDFQTAHGAAVVTLRTGEEAATQLERRAGVGFEPIVTRLVHGLESVVGGVDALDTKLPGAADAVFTFTGALLAGIAALAAAGFVAPAVKGGALLVAGAASGTGSLAWSAASSVAGSSLLLPTTAITLPIAAEALALHYQTPAIVAAQNKALANGPYDMDQDGFGPGSRPFEIAPPPPPPPQTLDITIHSDPGVSMSINRASDGLSVKTPDVGQTTNRP